MKKVFILSLVMAFISTLAFSQVVSRQNPKGQSMAKWSNVQQGTVSTVQGYVAPGGIRVLGDDCTDPFTAAVPATVSGTAIDGFTSDYGTALVTPWGYTGPDVVYSFTVAAAMDVSVTVTGDFDNILAAFTDCVDPAGSQVAGGFDDNYQAPFTESMVIAAAVGVTYYVVVAEYDGTGLGNWEITFEEAVGCVDNLVPAGSSEIEPNGGINGDPNVEYDPRTVGTEAAPTQVTGSLETVGGQRDMDWFNITLNAGDDFHAVVDLVCGDVTIFFGNADMSYYVYSEVNGEGMGEELTFSCDTTGDYWVVVSPPDFADRALYTYNLELWEGAVVVNPAEGESFEGVFPPAGWSTVDNDGDGQEWYKAELAAQEGANVASSASYVNDPGAALTPDNWLITPQIMNVDAAQEVKWWVAAQDPAWAGDKYAVMISTATSALSDFTITLHEETLTSDAYAQHVYDLSSYEGQSIWIAFRHYDCTDMFQMKLDDVVLPEGTNSIDPVFGQNIQIFPNPATDVLNISNAANTSIRVYNVLGEVVASIENANDLNTINLADFSNGTYIVKVTSDANVYSKKVVVNR